ncbi:DUF4239 domain-containing protein [Streptomyces orinoci]|uniref:DUF4239 domain-containing protein n=1 Tax=Streptomyces orinoci TaxID=67339 RepID=A0ABV3JRP7_STRON|nr:DUF4239 domain-containing protein [Streptomyces orinoci]
MVGLINSLGTVVLAFLFVGGAVCLAAAGSLLVRWRFPDTIQGQHNKTIGDVLGVYAAIYGIILAFVVVADWEALGSAEVNVAAEASQTAEVLLDAGAFPAAQRQKISTAIGEYVHAVVERQWPLMRRAAPDADLTNPQLTALYAAFQGYEPTTEAQKAYYNQAITNIGGVAAARRNRLTASQKELPLLLTALVYGGALVLIPLTFLYGIESIRIQLLFVCSIAALVGMSVLLVLTLDHPFSGDVSVSPEAFKQGILAQFW